MAADQKAVGSTVADQEEHSTMRVAKEDSLTATESHSVKESHLVTDHVEALAKAESHSAERKEASVKVEREEHSTTIESHSAEREEASEQRRASTRRISTISAMRTKAESTR